MKNERNNKKPKPFTWLKKNLIKFSYDHLSAIHKFEKLVEKRWTNKKSTDIMTSQSNRTAGGDTD